MDDALPLSGQSPEAAFNAFLQAVPDAVIASDADGVITAVNSQAETLFGYSRAELIGQKVELLVPEASRSKHLGQRQSYSLHPHRRPMGVGMDLLGRHKSGANIPVEISLSPLKTAAGLVILAAVRDVTERRQAQEALRMAQAQLELKVAERTSELLSANKSLRREIDERARLEKEVLEVSEREQQRIGQDLHDSLGQTLTAVTYIGQLLHKKIGGKDGAQEASEIVKLVSGAIDQVRGFSRGLYPVELKTNGLVPALQELASSMQAKYRVPCAVKHDDPDPVKDPTVAIQLYRIAQEAVNNAMKHAKAKQVTVRLTKSENTVRLSVEDDGQGLPAAATTGKGMGLHIMKYRADMIGAAFSAAKAEGGGTVAACLWRGPHA